MGKINENKDILTKEELIQLKVLETMLSELKISKFNYSVNDISNYVGSINLIKKGGKFEISKTSQGNLNIVLGEYKKCSSACIALLSRLVMVNNLNEVIDIFYNRVSEQLEEKKTLSLKSN